jgi:hypothetical protein
MKLGTRLARVEAVLQAALGCGACRGWTGVVLEGDDGPHRPEACLGCGRAVPVTQVVRLEGVQLALL